MTDRRDLSPLQEIELLVQQRARTLELDSVAAPHEMAALVEEAIAEWSMDHKRGIRRQDLADPDRLAQRAIWNLTGYGPLAPLLADDDVWEIMVNAPSGILYQSVSTRERSLAEDSRPNDPYNRITTSGCHLGRSGIV